MQQVIDLPNYAQNLQQLVADLKGMLPAPQLSVFNNDAAALARSYPEPLKLRVGDKAPAFTLPDAAGVSRSLRDTLRQGPVVLVFYRGVWCPYCNLQLKTYQQILPQIRAAGAQLVAVSPMTPDSSNAMGETNGLQFAVLSDAGNQVARQYTTVFRNPEASIKAMQELGYDFFAFYGDKSAELPVPAVFVIGRDGVITLARSEGGDYRERVEPAEILDALG